MKRERKRGGSPAREPLAKLARRSPKTQEKMSNSALVRRILEGSSKNPMLQHAITCLTDVAHCADRASLLKVWDQYARESSSGMSAAMRTAQIVGNGVQDADEQEWEACIATIKKNLAIFVHEFFHNAWTFSFFDVLVKEVTARLRKRITVERGVPLTESNQTRETAVFPDADQARKAVLLLDKLGFPLPKKLGLSCIGAVEEGTRLQTARCAAADLREEASKLLVRGRCPEFFTFVLSRAVNGIPLQPKTMAQCCEQLQLRAMQGCKPRDERQRKNAQLALQTDVQALCLELEIVANLKDLRKRNELIREVAEMLRSPDGLEGVCDMTNMPGERIDSQRRLFEKALENARKMEWKWKGIPPLTLLHEARMACE